MAVYWSRLRLSVQVTNSSDHGGYLHYMPNVESHQTHISSVTCRRLGRLAHTACSDKETC